MVLPAVAAVSGRAVAGNATKHTASKVNPRVSKSATAQPTARMFNSANDNKRDNKSSKITGPLKGNLKRIEAAAATPWIIFWTAPLYILQLIGFVFWVMGLGIGVAGEETLVGRVLYWTGITDGAAEVFMGLGMAMGLIAVTLSFLVAYTLYTFRKIDCFNGHYSLIIMALVFGFTIVPLSFLPGVWIWCAYVVVSQGSKT